MSYAPGDTFVRHFLTRHAAGKVNADFLPTAEITRNGTADGDVVVTVTNLSPGRYIASGTIPVGYVVGNQVDIFIQTTIDAIVDQQIVELGKLETAGTVAAIADAVWDEATSGHTTAGSFGLLIANIIKVVQSIAGRLSRR